jgi:hypothetical protein
MNLQRKDGKQLPKKRKTEESLPRLVPHENLIRKSISTGLIQTGAMLGLQARQLEAMRDLDGVRALSGIEHGYLQEAQEAVLRAQKICLVVGRRNQRASG